MAPETSTYKWPQEPALTAGQLDYIRRLVFQLSGVQLSVDDEPILVAKLNLVAARFGFQSSAECIDALRAYPFSALHQEVAEELLPHETFFFRDPPVFEYFRTVVVPDLLARRAPQRPIVIWSAACSTGQEPYSIAMLLHEEYGGQVKDRFQILASDVCPSIVTRAKKGIYNDWEVHRGLPERLRMKYFDKNGTSWQIREQIRSTVSFFTLNLCSEWTSISFVDTVFLRNVLVYMDQQARQSILARTKAHLKWDGYLFVGATELIHTWDSDWSLCEPAAACCYRRRQPAPGAHAPVRKELAPTWNTNPQKLRAGS
jgi:chemotaxis protein methyltransferase CheR